MFHQSILLETFLSFYENRKIRVFIDGTIGAGGHAAALLRAHPEIERFYAFDLDPLALEIAKATLKEFESKVRFIHANFREMPEHIEEKVDGIFLDLGVSSMQLDRPEKGFSFSKEGPLDMRMNPDQHLSAEIIVNTFSEKKLGDIFRDYGEEPRWKRAAKAIVESRKKKKIRSTLDLHEALKMVLTWSHRKGKKIHPMTLIFQALRIYVNDELGGLEEALPKAIELLTPMGRMGVISFHSLEDRIVKETFRRHIDQVKILTKKPLIASDLEVKQNPRSRSAKLRFIEKLE